MSREAQEDEKERRENLCAAIACSVLGGGAVWPIPRVDVCRLRVRAPEKTHPLRR